MSKKLDKVVAKVAGRYAQLCWWAEEEELKQEAWIAALDATRTWDPTVGVPLGAYAWRAAVLHLRTWLWKNSSPVSAPASASEEVRKFRRAGFNETNELIEPYYGGKGTGHLDNVKPGRLWTARRNQLEDERRWVDEMLDDERWKDRVRVALKQVLGDSPDSDLAVDAMLSDEKASAFAKSRGVEVQKVYRATQRARARISESLDLYRLWKERT